MNKNVLITGASGFLGQHLLNYNKQNNIIDEKDFVLLSSRNIEGYRCVLHKNYTYDSSELPQIDTVILMGAFCPKVRADINNINQNVRTVSSLGYLLNHLPNIPKRIVYVGTISVYGGKLINYPDLINENTQTAPDFLYGYSKLFSEEILKEYCDKNNVELSVLRLGVSYGENDDERKGTIPTIAKSILYGEKLKIYNEGTELKHFIHTDDISRIILEAATKPIEFGVINVVDNKAYKVIEIVRKVEAIYGKKADLIFDTRVSCNDSMFDNSKMLRNFGELHVPFDDGLTKVCRYWEKSK